MAQINVTNLTFNYEGSYDDVFTNVSFSIDTNWKLGFIGRNGKGKTTFLNLLMGRYEYSGSISTSTVFDYFPYEYDVTDQEATAYDLFEQWKPGVELWRVLCEMDALKIDSDILSRPFTTLSFGERTKVMLAVLFAGDNDLLLIDEPTNHLDSEARKVIREYLSSKKSFILVSHDVDLLDACIDHVLVLGRKNIDVQAGNFSSWWENKEKADQFAIRENEKRQKEIGKLKAAVEQSSRWAEKGENKKIGFDPIKEHDRSLSTRSYIGAKTKKMEARVKNYEQRMNRAISEQEGLLNDVEYKFDLKLTPLKHYKNTLVRGVDLTLAYGDNEPVIKGLNFEIKSNERVFIKGTNGSGKTTLIHAILGDADTLNVNGLLETASGLVISYINQDTTSLKGSLRDFAFEHKLDYSLFLSLLSQMDFSKVQFEKDISDFSEGQKKKILIASSLLTPAHLYIWDEPLNYIDVFSRKQIEKLILEYEPTMLVVEHDSKFAEDISTTSIMLG